MRLTIAALSGLITNLILTPLAAADADIDAPEDDGAIEAAATLGATVNQGNTDSELYNASLEYLQRSNQHRVSFDATANRGESAGVEDVNNTLAAAGYDLFLHGPWYANSRVAWQQDRLSDLYSRYSIGAGAGYQFFDDEITRLSVELGPSYIYEESLQARASTEEAAVRWSLDFRRYIGDGAMRLFHNHEVVVMTDDSENWYAITRSGLRLPLRENLSASLQFNYDYDNQPPPAAAKSYDSTTLFALTYDWQ